MRYSFAVFAAVVLVTSPLSAGRPGLSRVCGKVCDAISGRPLAGVHVISRQPGEPSRKHDYCCPDEVFTDSIGTYSVVPDAPTVTFSRAGYATITASWSSLRPFQKVEASGCPMLQNALLKRKQ
jgi:hypothetical protein